MEEILFCNWPKTQGGLEMHFSQTFEPLLIVLSKSDSVFQNIKILMKLLERRFVDENATRELSKIPLTQGLAFLFLFIFVFAYFRMLFLFCVVYSYFVCLFHFVFVLFTFVLVKMQLGICLKYRLAIIFIFLNFFLLYSYC
jgi:hypothetical protein